MLKLNLAVAGVRPKNNPITNKACKYTSKYCAKKIRLVFRDSVIINRI